MGWLYVPELEDWNSDSNLPWEGNIAVFVTSSGKPSLQLSSWRGWKNRPWIKLLSGTISRPLRAAYGMVEWISSLEDTPANRSRSQESVQEQRMGGTYGHISGASLEKLDLSLLSLRTSSDTYRWASRRYTTTLKRWGSELRRACSERKKLALPTEESDCSYWPTATAGDAKGSRAKGYSTESGRHSGTTLTDAVKNWPTPCARDYKGANSPRHLEASRGRKHMDQLPNFLMLSHQGQQILKLGEHGSKPGVLNPQFVETLMGLPTGWTDFAPSETQSSPQ